MLLKTFSRANITREYLYFFSRRIFERHVNFFYSDTYFFSSHTYFVFATLGFNSARTH